MKDDELFDDAFGLGDILDEQMEQGYEEMVFRDQAMQSLANAVVECRQFLTIPEVIQIVLDVFKDEA